MNNLKRMANWVCHRNKIPISPITGENAKSNDSTTWGTYEQASAMLERDKSLTGLGFMFSNSPYVGIDIDHCVTDGRLSDFAKEMINTFQSYTEYSPSGMGIHIICKGTLPGAGKKNSSLGLEMYDNGRYFTVTENSFKHYPRIGQRQEEIELIYQKYFAKKQEYQESAPKQQSITYLEDEKVIELAGKSRNGNKFLDLFAGNWQGYYASQSEADLAFCNALAFWTNCDEQQMDRIFRTSGLMREKWTKLHGLQTYGDMTITKAVDSCTTMYDPSVSMEKEFKGIQAQSKQLQSEQPQSVQSEQVKATPDETAQNQAEKKQCMNLDRFHKFNAKNEITGVFDAEIVDYIIETENIIKVGGMVYLYDNGVYKPDKRGDILKYKIQSLIYRTFQNSRTINRIYELLLIQPSLKKNSWELNQYPENWINFKNGMFQVDTWELIPHSPAYYSMNQIPHEWKGIESVLDASKNKKYENTEYFFNTSIHSDDRLTIFSYIGLCMTHNMSYQIFLLLLGEGANGKSLLISVINAILGEENISNVPMDKLTQRFYGAQLFLKLANTCADISKITIEDDAELKKIIGGDALQAEFKGKDSFSFTPYAKLLFSANRFPYVDDKSEGFKRRLRVVEMNKKPPKEDIHLKEKILKELDYWICFSVLALEDALRSKKITESENSKKIRQQLHKDSDSVYAFIQDCLLPQQGHTIRRSDMFKEYDTYCSYYERVRVKKKTFFDEMKAKGFEAKKDVKGYMVYEEIRFKNWKDKDDAFYPFSISK